MNKEEPNDRTIITKMALLKSPFDAANQPVREGAMKLASPKHPDIMPWLAPACLCARSLFKEKKADIGNKPNPMPSDMEMAIISIEGFCNNGSNASADSIWPAAIK